MAGYWKMINTTFNGLKGINFQVMPVIHSKLNQFLSETDGEADIDDNQATDWSSSDEDKNINDNDENFRND
ncbi:hypothetical protein TNCT_273261 [Trichonephila clavata]|uniref:Uncharacterized protein n=1 Tax=Trichonephila clavata TaxID=2740835 RepID=A0A8X6IRR7_TRICU|nr:hypothetical protein TNCT_273261 [Trichonephila clavata]